MRTIDDVKEQVKRRKKLVKDYNDKGYKIDYDIDKLINEHERETIIKRDSEIIGEPIKDNNIEHGNDELDKRLKDL
jgi:tRNA U54 and U55 pseudouridine synthase Pus10